MGWIELITEDPLTAAIPIEAIEQAVLVGTLIDEVTDENFDAVTKYILRPEFPPVLSAIVMMQVCKAKWSRCDTEAFLTWAKTIKGLKI